MGYENFKTLKHHMSEQLRVDVRIIEGAWRELRQAKRVRTGAGHLGAHTPTELSILRLLNKLAISRLGPIFSPKHRMTHNHIRSFRDVGIIVEVHGGVYVRVEIAPSIVRSILDFGKPVVECDG